MLALRACCILLLVLFCSFSLSWALVIDDCEEGPFSLMTSTTVTASQVVTPGLHCVANLRYVTLASASAGNTLFAQLNVSSVNPDDEIQCVFTGAGRLELEYLPNPTDLTAGGVFGRLDVMVTAVDPVNFDIGLELEDIGGGIAFKSQTIPGIGLQSFFLSDFPTVDPTQIMGIRIIFTTNNQGDLHVSDIRMRKVAASVVTMDALNVSVSGPPYPTPAIQFEAGPRSHPPNPIVPIEMLSLSLVGAQDFSDPPMPLDIELQGADSGGGAGMAGEVGQVAVFWTGAGTFPPASFFDVSTMVDALGEIQPCTLPPSLANLGSKAFQVIFQVDHAESGDPAGTSFHVLTFEIGNQPLIFASAELSLPPDPCLDDFHTEMILREPTLAPMLSDASGAAAIDPGEPLFTITIMADHGGSGAIVGIEPGEEPRLPLLRADPSVMQSHTTLRMNAPIERAVDLVIHDVMGRTIERLRIPAQGEVVWRGTDRWGRIVPAGVYLVHAPDLAGALATRIVKLR